MDLMESLRISGAISKRLFVIMLRKKFAWNHAS